MSKVTEKKSEKKVTYVNIEHVMLTYKTWIDKINLDQWLRKEFKIEELYIAHEAPDHDDGQTPYEHTHVIMKCKRTKINPGIKCNYMGIHPHVALLKVTKLKPWQLAINYIANPDKEGGDKTCHHLYKKCEEDMVKGIWNCNTISEALQKYVTRPCDANGIVTIFNHKDVEKQEIGDFKHEMHPWQKQLYELIMNDKLNPDQLTWIYDEAGLGGKSSLGIWLDRKGIASYQSGGTGGPALIRAIENAIKEGWNKKYLILDFARSTPIHTSAYETIEQLMNGMFTSIKYDSKRIDLGHRCKVIVFANKHPDVTALSAGRWNIITIKK